MQEELLVWMSYTHPYVCNLHHGTCVTYITQVMLGSCRAFTHTVMYRSTGGLVLWSMHTQELLFGQHTLTYISVFGPCLVTDTRLKYGIS